MSRCAIRFAAAAWLVLLLAFAGGRPALAQAGSTLENLPAAACPADGSELAYGVQDGEDVKFGPSQIGFCSGSAALQLSGGVMTGAITLVTPTNSTPSLICPPGVAPSSPTNGYLWCTSAGVFVRFSGVTQQLATTATVLQKANNLADVNNPYAALGNINGYPQVPTTSALSALPHTSYPSGVVRLGNKAAGDAPPLLFLPSAAACPLNAGAGDVGSQVPTSDSGCWLAQYASGVIPVLEFGAAPDAVLHENCMTTSGQPNISCAAGAFAASEQGKTISVDGAGSNFISPTPAIAAGGSGYAIGDFLQLANGATVKVTSLTATASFTASISLTTMTVTGSPTGTIATGQTVAGPGVVPGTTISSLGTGSGGAGTYNLSISQTVASEAMTGTAATGAVATVRQYAQPNTQPSNPVAQSATSGSGSGGTFTYAYTPGELITTISSVQTASFTGQMSGSTTLTVTSPTGSPLAAGQMVSAVGITAGTYIVSQLTGPTGAAGTYQLSASFTVSAESMTSNAATLASNAAATMTAVLWQSAMDGTLDNTALQAALAASAIGQCVRVDHGLYLVSAALTINNPDRCLVGDGAPRTQLDAGGPKLVYIGSTGSLLSIGSVAAVDVIKLGLGYFGIDYAPTTASFTGYISSTTLTVGSTQAGAFAVGQTIFGPGVGPGTTILSGSGPTYTVSVSQTVGSSGAQVIMAANGGADLVRVGVSLSPASETHFIDDSFRGLLPVLKGTSSSITGGTQPGPAGSLLHLVGVYDFTCDHDAFSTAEVAIQGPTDNYTNANGVRCDRSYFQGGFARHPVQASGNAWSMISTTFEPYNDLWTSSTSLFACGGIAAAQTASSTIIAGLTLIDDLFADAAANLGICADVSKAASGSNGFVYGVVAHGVNFGNGDTGIRLGNGAGDDITGDIFGGVGTGIDADSTNAPWGVGANTASNAYTSAVTPVVKQALLGKGSDWDLIHVAVDLEAQSGAIASTPITYTTINATHVPDAGLYQMTYSLQVTATGTGTLTPSLTWVDETGTSITCPAMTGLTAASKGSQNGICVLSPNGANNVSYAVANSGSGSTYTLKMTLQQVRF